METSPGKESEKLIQPEERYLDSLATLPIGAHLLSAVLYWDYSSGSSRGVEHIDYH